jgi:hypothetical protein
LHACTSARARRRILTMCACVFVCVDVCVDV